MATKKKSEYLSKQPIFPHFTPDCPKCQCDTGVLVCTPTDPKQYYCLLCNKDFFYLGCLNCKYADQPPFSFICVRCTRNPMPVDVLDEKFYTTKDSWSAFAPMSDRWKPYEHIDLDWIDK